VRFAVVFFAVDVPVLFVAVFLAVPEALAFFAGVADEVDFAVVFLAVVFFAVLFLAGADVVDFDVLLVAVFFAVPVAVFFAVPVVVFFAVPEAAVRFVAVDADLPVVFFAAVLEAGLAVLAAAVRFAVVDAEVVVRVAVAFFAAVLVAAGAFGSFLAPDTNAFSSAPARNFGTAVFFARVRSPVRGLRTIRAGRTAFSKAPNPVMATFSPRTTSRVTVSTTDSSACRAADLFPSNL
jgi:hypothetical protein